MARAGSAVKLPPPGPGWSPWERLPEPSPSVEVLAEQVDGGQAFRWNRLGDDPVWEGRWSTSRVRLAADGADWVWSEPDGQTLTEEVLLTYLGRTEAQDRIADDLPWRSDARLREARETFPGLRILHQPLSEVLLAFICSSTRQIIQIKQGCEAMATGFGDVLEDAAGTWSALPTWERLAVVSESQLRDCRLGYRAAFVYQTAQRLVEQAGWEATLATLPTEAARAWLMELPGVGRKVADCVLCFGLGRLEVFPTDVWIRRVLDEAYGLDGWADRQVQHFARIHFGSGAGLAQQWLFSWARQRGGR